MKKLILRFGDHPCGDCGEPHYIHVYTGQLFCGGPCEDWPPDVSEVPDYLRWKPCPTCKGSGEVAVVNVIREVYACPECDGFKKVREVPYVNPLQGSKGVA